MVSMRDLFPDGAPVSKESLRRHLGGPVANVQGFGARGDDSADDTPAIQAAIDHVQGQGGGVVYLPAGTYRIMPQQSIGAGDFRYANALRISGNNITLIGDGPTLSRLRFRTLNDNNPTDGFERRSWQGYGEGDIWRGSAIHVNGTSDPAHPYRNIVIAELEVDGGAYPGNTRLADGTNRKGAVEGWDISHKGILLAHDLHLRGVTLRNLHLHNFRGEVIYGGGPYVDDVVIEGCDIHSSAGDGISISAGQVIRDNRIHDIAHACVESIHFAKEARYTGNFFANAKLGINLQTAWDSTLPATISENVFLECDNHAILFNIENGPTFITGNLMIDCGFAAPHTAAIRIKPGRGVKTPVVTGIVVTNNMLLRKARHGGMGIQLGCDKGGILRSVFISENFIGSDSAARERDKRFLAPISYGFTEGAEVEGVVIRRNTYFRTQRHVENTRVSAVQSHSPMPLMKDNEAMEIVDFANSAISADGVTPSRMENEGPVRCHAAEPGTDPTPVFTPADYAAGQEFTLINTDAHRRVYFPQSSALYQCREGRFLVPGVELRLRCDGKRFIETGFVDRRETSHAVVVAGDSLDFAGHPECYASPKDLTRFVRFSGIGHGARVRLVATNRNVVIVHNEVIRLKDGTNLGLAENEVVEFLRTRDGVLRQL